MFCTNTAVFSTRSRPVHVCPLRMFPAALGAIAFPAAALLALYGLCALAPGAARAAEADGTPQTRVSVLELQEEDFVYVQEFAAVVEGVESVQVRAQVDGMLKARHYREGAWVEKGTLLFEIDDAEYATQVEMAQAQLQQAEAAFANALRELRRADTLKAKNAVSPKEYDAVATQHALDKAALAEARANLNSALLRLEKTKIRAPISGYADMALQPDGSLISASSSSGSLLTEMTNTRKVRVLFHVPGVRVRAINRLIGEGRAVARESITAELFEDAGVRYPHQGRLIFGSGSTNPQTGTRTAWAEFPNPDGALSAGQIVRIRLDVLEFPKALMLPQSAVQQGADGPFVALAAEDGTAAFAPVTVSGPYGSDFLVTPSEQVHAGTRVIIEGVNKVRGGMPVEAQPYTRQRE